MDEIKTESRAELGSIDNEDIHQISKRYGTSADQRDMHRMGKTQKLRRNFGFFSIFGFSMILLSTWETQLGTSYFGLANGGSGGLIWVYVGTLIGMSAVIASMAEMASMAPTAGGQYHWVSEFSPKSCQKILSYVVGWLCVMGWQTGAASQAFLAGTELQTLVILNYPDYDPQPWHGTLIVIAMAAFCGIFNTLLARKLPLVEGTVLILHILGFFAIIVPLVVLSPTRSTAKDVFFTFNSGTFDQSGHRPWSSTAVACLVGIIGPTVALLGSDAATHMSEELQDASYTLPRAMIATGVVNGTLGFAMLVAFCFCLGDIEALRDAPVAKNGFPFIQVFVNATKSVIGATIMTSILIFLATFCCITNIATASRQLFAFARDQGLPFSKFFAHVPLGWDIPLNSVLLTMLVSISLSLINIGSRTAYNNMTSLGVCALLSSYIVSISCVCLKRYKKQPLLPRRFSLGKAGFAINVFSILFLSVVFVFCLFPPVVRPNVEEMNWSVVMYAGVMGVSMVYYCCKGRRVYKGPVEYIRKTQ
ncbi:hypothetical protein BLS_001964 [Venturia inaequalis]|uniref:Amino acid transporter n=2 Tax=Venturia inaequalis TaxID=5025 RepID=A0A8H3UJJ7_VENIN|nr:hypothetical protein EG328_006149 [Venturia inaequalis]KAE9984589.1 hypothetical protein BLS_001964 [Venturia inaequalis]RDI79284.1 hypothetical protein Vi05172_g10699 [Venturia inaequalis]